MNPGSVSKSGRSSWKTTNNAYQGVTEEMPRHSYGNRESRYRSAPYSRP